MKKILFVFLAIIILCIFFYFFNNWSKIRIDLKQEQITDGWYKYSNDIVEFNYPQKLRNCYECSPTTGHIYTVLTDEDYIIMFMSNQNSSYLIEPRNQFAFPRTDKEKFIRNKIDSILINKSVSSTDTTVLERLTINSIEFNVDEEVMRCEMAIDETPFTTEISRIELDNYGLRSRSFYGLEKRDLDLRKFSLNSEEGRFYTQKDEENIFFEIQKIKNHTTYNYHEDANNLTEKDMYRFFKSIQLKN